MSGNNRQLIIEAALVKVWWSRYPTWSARRETYAHGRSWIVQLWRLGIAFSVS